MQSTNNLAFDRAPRPIQSLKACVKTLVVVVMLAGAFFGNQAANAASNGSQKNFDYSLRFVPSGYSWFDKLIQANSLLFQLKHRPPVSISGLRRRVKREKILLSDLLRSEGFYAGRVELIQNRGSRIGNAVSIKVNPGPLFKNKSYAIIFDQPIEQDEKQSILSLAQSQFKHGDRAKAATILETEQSLLSFLANNGFPFAKVKDRKVTVDHVDASVSVALDLQLGPRSTYGTTMFNGLTNTDPNFLIERMGIKKGAPFSQAELDEAKKRLLNTGLFTNVKIGKAANNAAFGAVPLTVEVRERPLHQVRLSAGASIDDGPQGAIEWRHRNLFGKAQNLILKVEGDKNNAKGSATFEWPDYLREDQILSAGVSAEYDGTAGLENTNLSANVNLSRWYDKKRTLVSIGPEIEFIKESNNTDIWLASLPVKVDFNRTNSLLNPSEGFRLFTDLRPYINLEDSNQIFLTAETGASGYLPLLDQNKLTLAGWAKAGAIFGDDLPNIPVSKRFYLGGSGSIRAYPSEGISSANFTGALAKMEAGIEFRTRFNSKIGAVAFLEGGKVFDTLDIDLKSNWRAGAGLGLRYFTSFGPVRVDFAAPVTETPKFDDIQILVGLGQAF